MSFKPMLASPANLETLQYPVYVSPKLDGIRASVVGGKLLTRALKAVPNKYVRSLLENKMYEGFDGELIVGDPRAKDVYLQTVSGVMKHAEQPRFTYYVFDLHDCEGMSYEQRKDELARRFDGLDTLGGKIVRLIQKYVVTHVELAYEEEGFVERGYEGVIIRSPKAPYKYGRSTPKEGYLLKLKRFEDSEAEIIGIEEEMHNANEAEKNELGRTKRSTAKAGLVGKGTMGALKVRDIHHGWEFSIGTGFTATQRAAEWKIGSVVKYKFFPVGMKDVPRHPVYIGPRSKLDL